MSTSLDASSATFKVPLELFNLPQNYSEDLRKEATDVLPRRKRLLTSEQLESPFSGYRDYMLFALRTRILPELQPIMGRNIFISYTDYPGATLVLSYNSNREPQITTGLSEEIKSLIEKQVNLPSEQRLECLLLKWNSVRYLTPPVGSSGVQERIPGKWLKAILPFIPHDATFAEDPSIPTLIYRNNEDALYADCLQNSDDPEEEYFMDLYSRMVNKILTLVKQWYLEGRVVDPSEDIIEDWKLSSVISIDGKTLFKPQDDWGISKVSRGNLLELPISGLLHDLGKGKERTVPIRAGVNLVNYHGIAKSLYGSGISTGNYYFSGGNLNFIPKNIQDLLFVINTVDQVLYGGEVSGAVFTLSSSRLSWIRVFSIITQRSVSKDLAVYVRRDLEPEFVFSAMVPLNSNVSELRREVLLRSRRLLVYLMKKLETQDIHSTLDNPETKLPEDLSSPTVRSYLNDDEVGSSIRF